ncbi:hypothetical protein AMAG_20668 [Allomyces macrogynus ATCC 38327]|uniref:ATPase RavA-like AAA lid domain-containing protein n=1 Tax=Allomyces macrogynus (strain ATCC 38327) TaxID=578462 RepID=A0A0L0TEB8_ALLM3|nr:hypothetical protein AMAG_20668 [Allomyces macrogynus ATCC 38327]|eukprot:KNE73015.1 hypothetical protein AMAG_20668 [Allomyces macrogynus ATCC 38327]
MILDLVSDVHAFLNAFDKAPVSPLPDNVKTMFLEHVRFANGLSPAGEAAAPPTRFAQTQSREVYCNNVITDRGIVAFSDILRIIALLHGRGATPCILDVFPLTYMSWHTMAQRKAVTNDMLGKLRDALPALVEEQGVKWVYDAICAHLFIPNAIKAALYSEILADLAHAGLVDVVVDLLRNPDVDPSHCGYQLGLWAVTNANRPLLDMLLLDDRIDTSALGRKEDAGAPPRSARDEGQLTNLKEARALVIPAEEADKIVSSEAMTAQVAADEGPTRQTAACKEEVRQVVTQLEKQGQGVNDEHALELAEKLLGGTHVLDLPALLRLSKLASQQDDLITLSAALVFHGAHVGEHNWIIPVNDPASSVGEVLRIKVYWLKISTVKFLVPGGEWDLYLRLRSPANVLPKIDVEIHDEAPILRRVSPIVAPAPSSSSAPERVSSQLVGTVRGFSKFDEIAASASSGPPIVAAPALYEAITLRTVDSLHPEDRDIIDPQWESVTNMTAARAPDVGSVRAWPPAAGMPMGVDDVARFHQQVDVRGGLPPPPYVPPALGQEEAMVDPEEAAPAMEQPRQELDGDIPALEPTEQRAALAL